VSLFSENRYQDCVDAFRARRQRVESLSDSIRNEKFLLSAALALEPDLRTDAGHKWTTVSELEDQMAWLDALVDKEGNRNTIDVTPASFRITSIYPNPFNGQTVISFELNQLELVEIGIFDISGRQIALVVKNEFNTGRHSIIWDASTVPTGVYFVKASMRGVVRASRIALVR